jgi:hypothetical protein
VRTGRRDRRRAAAWITGWSREEDHVLRSLWLLPFLSAIGMSGLPGCDRSGPAWEVTVENKTDVPCSFFITLGPDGGTKAHVDGITKGKPATLIAGSTDTVVQTVKVVRAADEQALTPNTALPVGKRYSIVLAADGKVEASVVSK